MRIIPVIDIQNGIAVHARRGDRASYAPLRSRFADRPDPRAIVSGLRHELDPGVVYVADLNAITRSGDNSGVIHDIAGDFPTLRLIVDRGLAAAAEVDTLLAGENIDIVIASESLPDLLAYEAIRARVPRQRVLLSLDRNGERRFGPAALFERVQLWPSRVIHMNLARVGAEGGPDLDGLAALLRVAGDHEIYAAGGVRHADDLQALRQSGVAGVLVGTALHDGTLDAALLAAGSRAGSTHPVTPA